MVISSKVFIHISAWVVCTSIFLPSAKVCTLSARCSVDCVHWKFVAGNIVKIQYIQFSSPKQDTVTSGPGWLSYSCWSRVGPLSREPLSRIWFWFRMCKYLNLRYKYLSQIDAIFEMILHFNVSEPDSASSFCWEKWARSSCVFRLGLCAGCGEPDLATFFRWVSALCGVWSVTQSLYWVLWLYCTMYIGSRKGPGRSV